MIWELFWNFFKIGWIAFGGGYAMVPVIEHEVLSHQWMTESQFAEAVALAGMAPGPIITNLATHIGYETAGTLGSISATLGIALPSVLIFLFISSLLYKVYKHPWMQSAFYGLKPVVAGLIIFAMIRLAMTGPMIQGLSLHTLLACILFLFTFAAISIRKVHPLAVILLSGLIGVAVFG